jgi:hypothetical protein
LSRTRLSMSRRDRNSQPALSSSASSASTRRCSSCRHCTCVVAPQCTPHAGRAPHERHTQSVRRARWRWLWRRRRPAQHAARSRACRQRGAASSPTCPCCITRST